MTEKELLKELAKFKLRNIAECPNCSKHSLAIQYEPDVHIKCSQCNFQEGLFTNTAIEGVNIPIMTIYNVVAYIQERVAENADFEFKRINLPGGLISVNELLDLYKRGEISQEITDELLIGTFDRDRVTSSEIARHYNLQDNEVEHLFTQMLTHTGNLDAGSKPNVSLSNLFERATIDSVLEQLMSPRQTNS